MATVPGVIPVTIPVTATFADPVPFVTDQTPPAVTFVNSVVVPAHTVALPVIGATTGVAGCGSITILADGNDVPFMLVTV